LNGLLKRGNAFNGYLGKTNGGRTAITGQLPDFPAEPVNGTFEINQVMITATGVLQTSVMSTVI
jgi:hypothetical protein